MNFERFNCFSVGAVHVLKPHVSFKIDCSVGAQVTAGGGEDAWLNIKAALIIDASQNVNENCVG